jgi:hypothetical protein
MASFSACFRHEAPAHQQARQNLNKLLAVGSRFFRSTTAAAPYTPQFELQVDAGIPAREIANAANLTVVDAAHKRVANPAAVFSPRRSKRSTRAFGSPNTPRALAYGRKPGKRNKSVSRREVAMRKSCQIFSCSRTPQTLIPCGFQTIHPFITLT